MKPTDKTAFAQLVKDAMAFYRRDVSSFALGVWWEACKDCELEQVAKALTAHAMNPDKGQFAPMPADIVRELAGTKTDRSLIAWGKVHGAMGRVGGYCSVAFDDAVIHATVEDMGGWPALCASLVDELPFLQKRFCETYRAYAGRPDVSFTPILSGVHAINNARFGTPDTPALIGDEEEARAVARGQGRATGLHISNSLPQLPRAAA